MSVSRLAIAFAVAVVVGIAAVVAITLYVDANADPPVTPVAEIVESPGTYEGEEVRVLSQVVSVREPFFTLGPDLPPGERLLVYPPREDFFPTITPQVPLAMEGRVERFDPAVFEQRFERSFDEFADLRGRLVVIADVIDETVPPDGTAGA